MRYLLNFLVQSCAEMYAGMCSLDVNKQITISDQRPVIHIGCDEKADIRPVTVQDSRVAKLHAVIEVRSLDDITLLDLGSEHGCLLNGQKAYKFKLKVGDKIQISPVTTITLTSAQEAPVNRLENLGKLVEATKTAVKKLQLNSDLKNACVVQDYKIAALSFGWPCEYSVLVEALREVFQKSVEVEHVRASGTILGLIAVIYDAEVKS